jgi:hypothetical protein
MHPFGRACVREARCRAKRLHFRGAPAGRRGAREDGEGPPGGVIAGAAPGTRCLRWPRRRAAATSRLAALSGRRVHSVHAAPAAAGAGACTGASAHASTGAWLDCSRVASGPLRRDYHLASSARHSRRRARRAQQHRGSALGTCGLRVPRGVERAWPHLAALRWRAHPTCRLTPPNIMAPADALPPAIALPPETRHRNVNGLHLPFPSKACPACLRAGALHQRIFTAIEGRSTLAERRCCSGSAPRGGACPMPLRLPMQQRS